MENKYNMSKKENLFFAKRKLVDNIYQSANLEGIAITFADTYDFMNNINSGKISIDDILKLKGLKNGWDFVLNTIEDKITVDYIKRLHFEICKTQNVYPLGEFRNNDVGISGTNYRPKLPSECNYDAELKEILNNPKDLDRNLNLFCWLQRSQMFTDGNKRVANILANKEMIRTGQGIISIPVDNIGQYTANLVKYYESNDNKDLKNWLYKNCVDGVQDIHKEIDEIEI